MKTKFFLFLIFNIQPYTDFNFYKNSIFSDKKSIFSESKERLKKELNYFLVLTTMSFGITTGIVIFQKINNEIIKLLKKNSIKKSKKLMFTDIGGYAKIKESLLNIIEEIKNPDDKNTNMTCILLYGPPGTGKTYIAQALANEANIPISILDSTNIFSSPYLGEAEITVKNILKNAKENAPSILFIDEIDNLLSHRKNSDTFDTIFNNIKNLFLTHMDGNHNMKGVILIGATNNIKNIDPAFLRSGRFEHQFFIDIPTYEDRLEIIQINLNKNKLDLDSKININYMANETKNLTSADLNSLFKNIKKLIDKKSKQKNSSDKINKKIITIDIFTPELEKIKLQITATKEKESGLLLNFPEIKNIIPYAKKIFNIQE